MLSKLIREASLEVGKALDTLRAASGVQPISSGDAASIGCYIEQLESLKDTMDHHAARHRASGLEDREIGIIGVPSESQNRFPFSVSGI